MKNELYFENVINIGNLYLEYVFLEFYKEPIFFTCIDANERMYICLCSEIRGEQRWIISECSLDVLRKVVTGTIDMASVFRVYEKVFLVKRNLEGKEESFVIASQNIDSLELPKEGTVLRCNQIKAKNYLANKKSAMLQKFINALYLEKKVENTYNLVFETTTILGLTQMNISDSVEREVLENKNMKQSTYITSKRTLYQSSGDKTDIENINDDYFFAA